MTEYGYDREREVREAIRAGERALSSLRSAQNEIRSARTWGTFDILGGGWFSGMMKHSKIDNARRNIEMAQRDLASFRDELSDVQDLQYMDIEIDSFLTFADFFFDGFLSDMFVQAKIRHAQDKLDEAVYRVENILRQLKRISD